VVKKLHEINIDITHLKAATADYCS